MTTLYSDTFTYSNGALTTVGSPNWSTLSGEVSWNVTTNALVRSAFNQDDCNYVSTTAVASWPNDQWGQLDSVTPNQSGNGGEGVGIALRCSTSARTYYRLNVSSTFVNLQRFSAGTWSNVVASAALTWTNGDTLYAEIQGSSIVVKQNGTTRLSTTDATFSAGRVGVFHSSDTSSSGSATVDTFSAGDFAAAGQDTPELRGHPAGLRGERQMQQLLAV